MGDNVIEDLNKKFKITFEDGTYIYKTGTDYTSLTVTTREHISEIFDNKESKVISIEIYVGCDIPFYTNNPNLLSATSILVRTYLNIGLLFSNLLKLTNITVDPANITFSSIDGVLFSKDGKKLSDIDNFYLNKLHRNYLN